MRLLERGTYTRLLLAILLTLLVLPLVGHHVGHPRWLSLAFFLGMLAAALEATQAAARTRKLVWAAGLLAILTSGLSFAMRASGLDGDHPIADTLLGVLNHGSSVLFLGIVVMLLVSRALAPGRVTGERVVASICAYLLLGLLWAEAYQVLGEIYGPVLNLEADATYQDYVYFSFVTLTTLGYGDVLPVHPGAKALAFLEAVTGVLYLATLVARLVALHIAHGQYDRIAEMVDDAIDERQDDGSSTS